MKYRKIKGSDTYHWCTNCANWPTSNYIEYDSKPSGEQCNDCKGKEKDGACKSS